MTAPGNRTIRRKHARPPDPRPCPTCYRPMALVNGQHECVKHGKPTRP